MSTSMLYWLKLQISGNSRYNRIMPRELNYLRAHRTMPHVGLR